MAEISPDALADLCQECLPALLALHVDDAIKSETLYDELALVASDAEAAASCISCRKIQALWGGMGAVYEIELTASSAANGQAMSRKATAPIILKHVELPESACTSFGDKRKAASYEVEHAFYERGHAAELRALGADVPLPLRVRRTEHNRVMTLAMTKLSGTPAGGLALDQCHAVMRWLAKLHARYWGVSRADRAIAEGGLQPQGSYWYLDTRRDEWNAMSDRGWEGRLKRAARGIDARLKRGAMQTCVHGDAKAANMLFRADGEVQMYDFQYIGKGAPGRDLAYVLMCAAATGEESFARDVLSVYLKELTPRLEAQGDAPPTWPALWDSYLLCVADLGRWMAGWGWWGQAEMQGMIRGVLDRLDGGQLLASDELYEEAVEREFGHV